MTEVPQIDLRNVVDHGALPRGVVSREQLEELFLGGRLDADRYDRFVGHILAGGTVVRARCGHLVTEEDTAFPDGPCEECHKEARKEHLAQQARREGRELRRGSARSPAGGRRVR